MFAPFYALGELLPATRASAERLGLVRLDDVVQALVYAVETPPHGVRVFDTRVIRARGHTR